MPYKKVVFSEKRTFDHSTNKYIFEYQYICRDVYEIMPVPEYFFPEYVYPENFSDDEAVELTKKYVQDRINTYNSEKINNSDIVNVDFLKSLWQIYDEQREADIKIRNVYSGGVYYRTIDAIIYLLWELMDPRFKHYVEGYRHNGCTVELLWQKLLFSKHLNLVTLGLIVSNEELENAYKKINVLFRELDVLKKEILDVSTNLYYFVMENEYTKSKMEEIKLLMQVKL